MLSRVAHSILKIALVAPERSATPIMPHPYMRQKLPHVEKLEEAWEEAWGLSNI